MSGEEVALRLLLEDAFGRVRAGVEQVLEDLTDAQLQYRPAPGANTIAWLVWHLSRVQDDHVAEAAGLGQVWTEQGWCERFALPLDPLDTGYGHSAEQVRAVRAPAPLLGAYHEAVFEQTAGFVRSLTVGELDRVVDESFDPPVTLAVRLVSVLDDDLEHVGQAAYLRGTLLAPAPAT